MAIHVMPSLPLESQSLPASYVQDKDDRPQVPHDAFSDEVPVVSLAGIDDAGERRINARKKIVETCEKWGVFQAVDHGVDQGLVDEMVRLSKEFFALPAQEKLEVAMSGDRRGGYLVSSTHQERKAFDWREYMMFFTYPVEARDYKQWPESPNEWRKVMEDYAEKLTGLSYKLLELLSEAMNLKKDAIAKACLDIDQKVIVNFYPRCPQPDLTFGQSRHTDPGLITILLQDQVGGLQVTCDHGKTWIPVRPLHGAFVVNLGDYGSVLSNGRFKSCDHRAVVNSSCNRISVATFLYPSQEAMVYPLGLHEEEKPIIKKGVTFKEMYKKKMNDGRIVQV